MKEKKWGWKKRTAIISIVLTLMIVALFEISVTRKHMHEQHPATSLTIYSSSTRPVS